MCYVVAGEAPVAPTSLAGTGALRATTASERRQHGGIRQLHLPGAQRAQALAGERAGVTRDVRGHDLIEVSANQHDAQA